MDARRRKLLFRADHRGFKEMDLIMGGFAKTHIEELTDAQLDEFEVLLEAGDQDVYGWIIRPNETPDENKGPVMEMLQSFDVSGYMKSVGLL
jgi:antitoxin CptB